MKLLGVTVELRAEVEYICRQAESADLSGSGSIVDFEVYLERLLSLLTEHLSANRQQVIECLSAIGKGEIIAPRETVPFCMHSLKLAEVIEQLIVFSNSIDPKSRRAREYPGYVDMISESIDVNWRESDLFRFYRECNT